MKNIWYIHPYAGGPNLGNTGRPYYLCREWNNLGFNATVFCSAWHHLMFATQTQRQAVEMIRDVRYCFVESRKYDGNGLSRILNMLDFCVNTFRNRRFFIDVAGHPDVIIPSSPHPYSILSAWVLSKLTGAKLILEVRDIWPMSLVALANVPKWHPLVIFTGFVERFAYQVADRVVSLLPNALHYMKSKGLDQEKFAYIPNGVTYLDNNEDLLVDDPAVNLARNLRGKGKFVVVYPGAMGPPNNMLPLLRAAGLLFKNNAAPIEFILMGTGGDVPTLKTFAQVEGLSNVHFFDQSSRQVALSLMHEADAGYVSVRRLSLYKHGISFNKLFEYMQVGLPVVFAADVPNNPVGLSGCGIETSPDEPEEIAASLVTLQKKSKSELRAMGAAGMSYVKSHHDYMKLARDYVALFECSRLQLN